MKEIYQQMNEIFRNELDNPAIELMPETTAHDIPEWDSLSNIQLVVAIEKKFNIRFTTSEILTFKNVGEMAGAIARKISA